MSNCTLDKSCQDRNATLQFIMSMLKWVGLSVFLDLTFIIISYFLFLQTKSTYGACVSTVAVHQTEMYQLPKMHHQTRLPIMHHPITRPYYYLYTIPSLSLESHGSHGSFKWTYYQHSTSNKPMQQCL